MIWVVQNGNRWTPAIYNVLFTSRMKYGHAYLKMKENKCYVASEQNIIHEWSLFSYLAFFRNSLFKTNSFKQKLIDASQVAGIFRLSNIFKQRANGPIPYYCVITVTLSHWFSAICAVYTMGRKYPGNIFLWVDTNLTEIYVKMIYSNKVQSKKVNPKLYICTYVSKSFFLS